MNGSRKNVDYFMGESINPYSSVNRSFNHSPTSGRVHKLQSSYGPRITLVNRSREQNQNSQVKFGLKQEHLQEILLLALEIQRLKQQNNENKKSMIRQAKISYKTEEKQFENIKKTNQSYKIAIKNLQGQIEELKRNYYLKQTQFAKKITHFQQQKYYLMKNIDKLKQQLNATRAQNKEILTKSKAIDNFKTNNSYIKGFQQKNKEIQDLREIILQYEYLIKDQRNTIQLQKQEIGKTKKQHFQIQTSYQKHLQDIHQKINYELVNKQVNTSNHFQIENVQQLQLDLLELKNDLKQKQSTIYQLTENNTYLRENYLKLQSKYYDLEFNFHTKITKIQEEKKSIMKERDNQALEIQRQNILLQDQSKKYQKIISSFENYSNNMKFNLQTKYSQMVNQLNEQQKNRTKKKRLKLKQKNQIPSSKSIEQTSFFYRENPSIKKIKLQQTIQSVEELRKSVQKNSSLIQNGLKKSKRKFYNSQSWKSQQTIKIGKQNLTIQKSKEKNKNLKEKSNTPFQIYYKC